MSEEINQNRRRFLGAAALTIAAAQVGKIGSAKAQSNDMKPAALPAIKPGTSTSFGALKQIDAGVLNVGYAEAGPANGPAVILLHGWPYDIHSFVDVAPLLAAAEERLSMLSPRAANLVDRAGATRLRVALYTTLDRPDRSVEVCLEYLREAGIEWSRRPTDEEVRQEYERMRQKIGNRSIEALFGLPLMSDPDCSATMDVLFEVLPAALYTDRNLPDLVILRMANLSIEYGNSDGSCFAYAYLYMVLGSRFSDYRAGSRFGQLSFDLVEQRRLDRFKARVYLCLSSRVIPWTQHLRSGRALVRRAFEAALEAGDLTYAAYSCNNLVTNLLAGGDFLDDVQHEAENNLEFVRKARFGLVTDMITGQLQFIRTLRGLTPEFGSFSDDGFDESPFEQHLEADSGLAMAACRYWIRKLQARYYAADYPAAIEAAAKAQRLLSPSFFEEAEYHFYGALACAASCDSAMADQRRQHLEALAAHHKRLVLWSQNCPDNFGNCAALIGAEIARVEGRELEAERLYEEAIRLAREHGFVQNEGLANELASRFYAARGFETIAHAYLRNARYCYLRWGAEGKAQQLDELHPHLREDLSPLRPTATVGTTVEHLDLATVVKTSQAVSGEIVLDKLIHTLMVMAVEHAGPHRRAETAGLTGRHLPGERQTLFRPATSGSGASATRRLRASARHRHRAGGALSPCESRRPRIHRAHPGGL